MLANSTTAARPFVGDRSAQHRRAMIGKINIARQQLNMDEDDYRQLLADATGHLSLRVCTDADLEKMLQQLQAKGFTPLPKNAQRRAQHPMARKARALWISLHHLGVVRNSSEKALEAFAQRQLGCDRLVWANQGHAYKLIEALKDMAKRNGWRQTDINGKPLSVIALQTHLCEVIVAKLKEADAVPADWTIDVAAKLLCGIDTAQEAPFSAETYARLAAQLGKKLRELVKPEGEA